MSRCLPNPRLRELSPRLRGEIPDFVADLFDEYVDFNEPELALETLFDELNDNMVTIPGWLAECIVNAAEEYEITRFTRQQVYALVRSEQSPPT
jgi:hypothetical protein